MRFIFLLIIAFPVITCAAESSLKKSELSETVAEAELVRRVSIFPLKAPSFLSEEAEDAWWKVREELTGHQRFLVASRHFLNKMEVLQPRDDLKPADVLVLARLLEAHALITGNITAERFHFAAYDGETGWLLWQQSMLFDQDIPLKKQVGEIAIKLTKAFVAALPYQGFIVKNQSSGDLTVIRDDRRVAQVFVGTGHRVQIGDVAQRIRLTRKGLGELFRSSGEISTVIEGKVVSVADDSVFVAFPQKEVKALPLAEFQLIRFPEEAMRLSEAVQVIKDPTSLLLKKVQGKKLPEESQEKGGALITALSFIGNALLFIVLAF